MFLSLLLAVAAPESAPCIVGKWDLNIAGETLFRFDISDASGRTKAVWERPENFEADGFSFKNVEGPQIERAAMSVKPVDGDVRIAFDDPRPGATPDVFRLHCVDPDHLRVTYEESRFEPLDFIRAKLGEGPLGPWSATETYSPIIKRSTNAEMTEIYNADQADRQSNNIDWSVVGPADKKRRARTAELLKSGALQSGEDYEHAAFVYQHGDTANDYLMAHLLAMIAVARGNPGAIWIASATLDRYLQTISKSQVLGTQYRTLQNGSVTQDPYDRDLVSDSMRQALHVRTQAEQEEQRKAFAKEAAAEKKP